MPAGKTDRLFFCRFVVDIVAWLRSGLGGWFNVVWIGGDVMFNLLLWALILATLFLDVGFLDDILGALAGT